MFVIYSHSLSRETVTGETNKHTSDPQSAHEEKRSSQILSCLGKY